jgi:P27 family predicted phage terminase small subunit
MPARNTERQAPKKRMNDPDKQQLAKAAAHPAPVIECPPELGPVARQEWDRLALELTALGRLTSLDRGPLAVYCTANAAWLEAVDALQKYGTMMKSPNGHPIQSPHVSIATKQAEIMIRIAAEFGFTPASRSRMPRHSKSDDMLLELTSLENWVP